MPFTQNAPPISARRAQTRERLVEAARQVIAERGLEGSSVEEISERAGFTRGAFYSNFSSKDELCEAILKDITEARMELARAAVREANDHSDMAGDEVVRAAIELFVQAQPQTREEVLVLRDLQSYAVRSLAIREAFATLEEVTGPPLRELISAGLERYGYRFVTSPQIAMRLINATFEHTALDALMRGDDPNGAEMVESLSQLFFALVTRVTAGD